MRRIKEKGVEPVNLGKVIVATWEPHETAILETIRELGLELQVIFNKGAVMVLPAGVNKATGLTAALKEMGLSPHNVVGVGDAENDHAFLKMCECSAAVSNALPKVKERVDITLKQDHGEGVTELIDAMLADDLQSFEHRLERYHVLLGTDKDGQKLRIRPHGMSILVAGSSGAGKSTLTTGLLERISELTYQLCIIDPEGDYDNFSQAVSIGNQKHAPATDEVLQLVRNVDGNANINLIGQKLQERPGFFLELLPRLLEMRHQTARPHWIVVDEAHHMLPGPWDFDALRYMEELERMIYITLMPSAMPPVILETIDIVVAVGNKPEETIRNFCDTIGIVPPRMNATKLERGQALVWERESDEGPRVITPPETKTVRKRHSRKYAEGELIPERSFYFRGPEEKLNLRAQNLILFTQIGDGVDEATWMFHLKKHDYSKWFKEQIKDGDLGDKAHAIESDETIDAAESRKRIREAIEEHYTLPGIPLTMSSSGERKRKEEPGTA